LLDTKEKESWERPAKVRNGCKCWIVGFRKLQKLLDMILPNRKDVKGVALTPD